MLSVSDGDRRDRQKKLRERFLDLADVYVRLRMTFLRAMGVQPPEEDPGRGKRKP